MNKRAYLLIAVLILTIFSTSAFSAPDAGEKRYEEVLESWIGADINNLIDSWGPPDQQYRMPNGNMLYTWIDSSSVTMPFMNDGDTIWGGGTLIFSCTTTFSVQPSGRIFSWRWKGNKCRSK
jgi:hypothetical protein